MTNYVVSTTVNGSFEVPDGGTNTSTSLVLIGRGASGYGQIVANNTIFQLQNFAGPTAPTTPLIGQLWYNSGSNAITFYNGTIWSQVAQTSDLLNYAPLAAFNTVQSEVNNLIATCATQAELANYVTINELTNPTGTTPMFVRADASSAPTQDNSWSVGTSTLRFANIYSVTFQGTATSAEYADLAERCASDMLLEAGDVVILGGNKEITKSAEAFSTDVFGVISTNPAYMMNSTAGDRETHPYVALAGRVPVKVTGTVKKGQRLVTSPIAGVAMAVDISALPNSFVVIGRALADKITDDVGLVEITVGAK
jgi:hypothetical protein